MTLGNKIESRRKELKLTQQELAQRTRLSQGYVSKIERDDFAPKASTLIVIAFALEIPYKELLNLIEDREGQLQ